MGLCDKEKALLEFSLKADADANGITDKEFKTLKDLGATDEDIVEALECMTMSIGMNRFCDALGVPGDEWLSN